MIVMDENAFKMELEKLRCALMKYLQRHPDYGVNDIWWYAFGYLFGVPAMGEKEQAYTASQISRIKDFIDTIWLDHAERRRKNVHP